VGSGPAQRTPVVCGSRPDDAALDRYVAVLPVPRLHVHLTATPDELFARIRTRERTSDRQLGLDDAGLTSRLMNDITLYRRCAESLRRAALPTLEVPNDRGRSESVDGIVAALMAMI
jgi:hypothetical protein